MDGRPAREQLDLVTEAWRAAHARPWTYELLRRRIRQLDDLARQRRTERVGSPVVATGSVHPFVLLGPGSLLYLLIAALCLSGAELRAAIPEFTGYLQAGGTTYFVLRHPDSEVVSRLLMVHQSFNSYTISQFDPILEILYISSQNGRTTIPLYLAKTRRDPFTRNGDTTQVTIGIIGNGIIAIDGKQMNTQSLYHYLATLAIVKTKAIIFIVFQSKPLVGSLGEVRNIINSAGFDDVTLTIIDRSR